MGEAKRRMEAESQPNDSSMTQDVSAAKHLIESGAAPHYALIFDRSPTCMRYIEAAKEAGVPEIHERLTSESFISWKDSGHPFVVIWGSWGMTGGMTVLAESLESLLETALPAAFQQTEEKGGYCTFIPVLTEPARTLVSAKITEYSNTDGNA